jgi:hypothetical protein
LASPRRSAVFPVLADFDHQYVYHSFQREKEEKEKEDSRKAGCAETASR